MSTVASANCTPLVPDPDESPSSHLPSTEIGSVPSSLQASFHARPFDGLPLTWMRPVRRDERPPASTPSVGATFANSASSALTDGDANGRRDRRGRRAAARPAAERVDRVADLRLHGADRQPERFGRDHRDDRARAGADVLRAALHDHAAVGHDVAVRLRAAAAAAPAMRRQPMPVLIGPGVGSPVGCRLSQPNSFAPRSEVLGPHRVRRLRRQVLDAELDRIHLHAIRELVHQDFGEEAALRMARRAHRALLPGVDVDVLVRALPVREVVDVRQREARRLRRRRRCPSSARRTPSACRRPSRRPGCARWPTDGCRCRDALPCDRASASPAPSPAAPASRR